jgi:hypothetical protein
VRKNGFRPGPSYRLSAPIPSPSCGRYRSACPSFGDLSGRNLSQTLRLALRGRWILDSYPKMARGKYEETIQFGWSTISEILRSTTRLAST